MTAGRYEQYAECYTQQRLFFYTCLKMRHLQVEVFSKARETWLSRTVNCQHT